MVLIWRIDNCIDSVPGMKVDRSVAFRCTPLAGLVFAIQMAASKADYNSLKYMKGST